MKIIYCSDFNIAGSGYKNISIPLCNGLTHKGHELKVIGLAYHGEEHYYPYTIIPCNTFVEMTGMVRNLKRLWQPDMIVASMDIPWHGMAFSDMSKDPIQVPYVGIFPVEGDPLCLDWAMTLSMMNAQLSISKFGVEECKKVGIPAEEIPIGIDTESWRLPTTEEQTKIREAFGFGDMPVILTVADNQERKNLGRTFEVVSEFKRKYKKPFIYALVTRENNEMGYRLRTLASRPDIDISENLRIFERGLSFVELWSLYAVANVFLLLSKAEGLGMPILESMAMTVPVVATDCTGIHELLDEGRGILVKPQFKFPDPFGNSYRYMVSIKDGAKALVDVITEQLPIADIVTRAKEFADKRTWDLAVNKLDETIRRIYDVKKEQEKSKESGATTA